MPIKDFSPKFLHTVKRLDTPALVYENEAKGGGVETLYLLRNYTLVYENEANKTKNAQSVELKNRLNSKG